MGKLILTRKPGESVKIGQSILTVREVHPKKVYVEVQIFVGPFVQSTHHYWIRLFESTDAIEAVHANQCKVTIAAISGRQVRLHFDADSSVKIVRSELL